MSCTSGCPTPGAHVTWGECLRSKGVQVTELQGRDERQAWDAELGAYASARRQGIQPKGTRMHQVQEAVKFADATGVGDPWQ